MLQRRTSREQPVYSHDDLAVAVVPGQYNMDELPAFAPTVIPFTLTSPDRSATTNLPESKESSASIDGRVVLGTRGRCARASPGTRLSPGSTVPTQIRVAKWTAGLI